MWVYKAFDVCLFEEIIVCMQSEDKNDEVTSMQSKNSWNDDEPLLFQHYF